MFNMLNFNIHNDNFFLCVNSWYLKLSALRATNSSIFLVGLYCQIYSMHFIFYYNLGDW